MTHLADYLTSLFRRGLAPATVKVHRAALCSVLKLSRVFSTEEEVILHKLLRARCLERQSLLIRHRRGTWGWS